VGQETAHGRRREQRVTAHEDAATVLDHTLRDVLPLQQHLAGERLASTLAMRATCPDQPADPTIAIIADREVAATDARRLVELAGAGGLGLAVVLPRASAPDVRWQLVRTGVTASGRGTWRLNPLGIHLRPVGLAADELADLAGLLADASAPPTVAGVVLPFRRSPSPDTEPPTPDDARAAATHEAPYTPPDWKAMVRLLGPADLVGTDLRPLTGVRDRTVEALAWLVLHPGGTRTRMEAALWPTGARTGTISNTLSRARTALEQLAGPEAHDWIPGYSGDLTISTSVTTDLNLLQHRLAHALRHRDDTAGAIVVLRDGLGLVRGTPAGYPWLDAELGSTLSTTPTNVALLLAELCLEQDDIPGGAGGHRVRPRRPAGTPGPVRPTPARPCHGGGPGRGTSRVRGVPARRERRPHARRRNRPRPGTPVRLPATSTSQSRPGKSSQT
jgi:hypothetical protein